MPKFHVTVGLDSTSVYPGVRKIGPSDLKDALAKGTDDFLTMPSSLVFLGLIYPIVGIRCARQSSALLFPLMSGFALIGPLAAIGLYEISRRRETGLDTSWAHAFGVARSHSIFSILSLGLLLLVIFAGWEFTAHSLYVSLFGSTPPKSFIQFVANILGTPQGWKLIGFGTAIGFVFAVVALSISVVCVSLASRPRCRRPGRHSDFRQGRIDEPFHHGAVGINRCVDPGDRLLAAVHRARSWRWILDLAYSTTRVCGRALSTSAVE